MAESKNNGAAYDVAIIGGGPGGSTTGSLLKKYNPDLRVLILEKAEFPRDHIGESQLPAVSQVLVEMGVWDEVERAGFPVKIGGTYTWGKTTEPWIFEFVSEQMVPPADQLERPGTYAGWRTQSAFQVDRSVYDDILLKHARKMGCEVREQTAVTKVVHEDDEVAGLMLNSGETITASYYIDASGNAAILRRALGVKCEIPTLLKNVAFWEYWENPEWANEPDVKATRIHIRSLPYGWIWFIRLSAVRASVGVVCPGEYYKSCGKKPAELYRESIQKEAEIAARLASATPRGEVEGTTDWSFVVDRTFGKNWFLVGESAGFADPILSAGLTLTQVGGRELAYTILELGRGEHDGAWLIERFDELQRRRVRQHMRFADFWYSSNGIFEDVRENCVKIAEDAGLKLTPAAAFRWLSQGGLGDDFPGRVGVGGHDLASMRHVMHQLTGESQEWLIDGKNRFQLNLANAKEARVGLLQNGRIHSVRCWKRNNLELAEVGIQGLLLQLLRRTEDGKELLQLLHGSLPPTTSPHEAEMIQYHALQVLEALAHHHWVLCSTRKSRPKLRVSVPEHGRYIHSNRGEARIA